MTLIQFIIIVPIALLLIIISSLIAYIHKQSIEDSNLGTMLMVIGWVLLLVGGILMPTLATNKNLTEYQKIYNPEILIGEYSVVVNQNELQGMKSRYFPKSFNSHRIKVELNDSTQFFLLTKRSFYRLPMERKVVWSNPPYEVYFEK